MVTRAEVGRWQKSAEEWEEPNWASWCVAELCDTLLRVMPSLGKMVENLEHLTPAEWQTAVDAWREWNGEVDDGGPLAKT